MERYYGWQVFVIIVNVITEHAIFGLSHIGATERSIFYRKMRKMTTLWSLVPKMVVRGYNQAVILHLLANCGTLFHPDILQIRGVTS